jgi:hypothetical protein
LTNPAPLAVIVIKEVSFPVQRRHDSCIRAKQVAIPAHLTDTATQTPPSFSGGLLIRKSLVHFFETLQPTFDWNPARERTFVRLGISPVKILRLNKLGNEFELVATEP